MRFTRMASFGLRNWWNYRRTPRSNLSRVSSSPLWRTWSTKLSRPIPDLAQSTKSWRGGIAAGILTPLQRTMSTSHEAGLVGNAGIVDCISFGVLRRLALTEVFSNDRHFQAAGFTILF